MSLGLFFVGAFLYFVVRVVLTGLYTVKPNERAIVTSFGRAERLPNSDSHLQMTPDEQARYIYPQVRVIGPGGPYLKLPWQKVHKVDVATQTVDITWDPEKSQQSIEAVTKDNLTTGIRGQLRYRASEQNLYAYVFGVQRPLLHVMGYFISILRERIANFTDPKGAELLRPVGQGEDSGDLNEGVSINDLRKNLTLLNSFMEEQCQSTAARYGIELDAALITEIDPPPEVDRALAAINSTRNQVAADISTARAEADQQITMSKRAVEIADNHAEAEVAPLRQLAATLESIHHRGGPEALGVYLRNMRIPLLEQTRTYVRTQKS